MRAGVLALLLLFLCLGVRQAETANADSCGDVSGTCGVTGEANHFHGVLAVTGADWVLNASASGGTAAGCGDCEWSMVPACVTQNIDSPDTLCGGSINAPTCDPGQVLYRLYLSTDAFVDRDEGVLCIGGSHHPIAVGDIGVADIARYLDNVTPPDLRYASRPRQATLAGLRTFFSCATPASLQPEPFGGPTVTETITITPTEVRWHWGDHTASGWVSPDNTMIHAYLSGGNAHGLLATRWHASYTISYAGRTFGPYDATRGLTKSQHFTMPVRTSSPTLVSH